MNSITHQLHSILLGSQFKFFPFFPAFMSQIQKKKKNLNEKNPKPPQFHDPTYTTHLKQPTGIKKPKNTNLGIIGRPTGKNK